MCDQVHYVHTIRIFLNISVFSKYAFMLMSVTKWMILRLSMAYVNCLKHLQIFFEIEVMAMKLQLSVSQASLIFQKNVLDAMKSKQR